MTDADQRKPLLPDSSAMAESKDVDVRLRPGDSQPTLGVTYPGENIATAEVLRTQVL